MGSRDRSSRPEPRPVVPIITPLMLERDFKRWISWIIAEAGEERGSVAKA